MVVRTLDAKKDPFHPSKDEGEILEPEIPYLSAIGALLYLAQCTRPNISFAVNLLARYSNVPAPRHCNGVKDILLYLKGTTDLGLFYTHKSSRRAVAFLVSQVDSRLVDYIDARYLFDPHRRQGNFPVDQWIVTIVCFLQGPAMSWWKYKMNKSRKAKKKTTYIQATVREHVLVSGLQDLDER
ncbi:secreted RxLR effector protein 161-like [Pyrus communis]|uniref:secreted RxLR effector protein 161-like n=1 Tax=Pyrus communis TaxID=23211 RepID=UPI0035C25EBC